MSVTGWLKERQGPQVPGAIKWSDKDPAAGLHEQETSSVSQSTPFDPRVEVSADARYLLRNLIVWFLVLPLVLGVLIWLVTR